MNSDDVRDVPPQPRRSWKHRKKQRTQLSAHGEPMIWLTGGALATCLAMISLFVCLVVVEGADTFWPIEATSITTKNHRVFLGELTREETYKPAPSVFNALPTKDAQESEEQIRAAGGIANRRLLRTGNYELTNEHFHWVDDFAVATEAHPEWALVVERVSWGRFYGLCQAFEVDDKPIASTPETAWGAYLEHHDAVRSRWQERRRLERDEIGAIGRSEEIARLEMVQAGISHGRHSDEYKAMQGEFERVRGQAKTDNERVSAKIRELDKENNRYKLVLRTADGKEAKLALADIVRAYPANQLTTSTKLKVYFDRWWEFLSDEPREANSEGGVFPAIFGTVVMTLLMSIAVVPFGVLAALYLREYAKAGLIVSAVRIAVNNLAGVPSIVFGVFGLGFFCYTMGTSVDELFFAAKLPKPTFGTGGILWSALTLSLLTLPVVIVATEEALAAVPSSMREGSYACGASKWQTIRNIVLPRALPGIMTGMILAMARGAGEVAPLMLVGAVKLAPELPVDDVAPYVHPERSFMHLGFHIYDVGFQSQNSEAAKPMVYTTTLLLITIIAVLNLLAIWLRMRLRRRFVANQF